VDNIENIRDHLFISYASEDFPFAEWLFLKLTSEGYRVWWDKNNMIGGESYPKVIDDAIKNKAFRVIALLSKYSILKDNPLKERTLALTLAKKRKEDFLITLNLDRLKPDDIDWMAGDINFIPFHNLQQGLIKLLNKLEKINAPKPIINGKGLAASHFLFSDVIVDKSEIIYSNILPIISTPNTIYYYRFDNSLNENKIRELFFNIPNYHISAYEYLTFEILPFPDEINEFITCNQILWKNEADINGIKIENIISSLIITTVLTRFRVKGLKQYKYRHIYFPYAVFSNKMISFIDFNGVKKRLKVAGQRSFKKTGNRVEMFFYHLGANFKVRRDMGNEIFLQINIKLHITDKHNVPLQPRSANARRKLVTQNWWNDDWLNRISFVCNFLSDNNDCIKFGDHNNSLIISARPISSQIEKGLNDDYIDQLAHNRYEQKMNKPSASHE
jgi:hypothetical protein